MENEMTKQPGAAEKKTGNLRFFNKWASLGSICLMGITGIMILLLLFMPVIYVESSVAGSYGGPDYLGWQIAFYYPGIQILFNTYVFGFNFLLSFAVIFPLLVLLVVGLMWRKAGPVKRSVILFIAAGVTLFAALVYLNAFDLAASTASSSDSVNVNMQNIIKDSTNKGLSPYTILTFVICLIAAVAETALGIINLIRRKKM